jgi:hypothetical protein
MAGRKEKAGGGGGERERERPLMDFLLLLPLFCQAPILLDGTVHIQGGHSPCSGGCLWKHPQRQI